VKFTWNPALAAMPEAFISLSKPKRVVDAIFGPDDEEALAPPAFREELVSVHSMDYVDSVLNGTRRNGFGTQDQRTLAHVLAANGAMRTAAELALKNPGDPILAPVSGFHHAGFADGHGYCTFNGLVLAALVALGCPIVGRVLIIDGDGHYGDGTDDVIARLGLGAYIRNVTRMSRTTWFHRIDAALRDGPWNLILYQAGADAHENDPYGVGYLTDNDWRDRDEMVFLTAMTTRTPIVWNLAGGYNGAETYRLHAETGRVARLASGLLARRLAAEEAAAVANAAAASELQT